MPEMFQTTTENTTAASGQWMGAGDALLALLGVLAILVGAYYVTVLIARRGNQMQQGRVVRILDRFAVGKDKMFCLLEMGGYIYLVGMSEGAVSLIDRLDGPQADSVRSQCRQAEQSNIIHRGVSFFSGKKKQRRFGADLENARKKWEDEHSSPQEASGLEFAREEDDIDAVLRQLSARKSKDSREDDKP